MRPNQKIPIKKLLGYKGGPGTARERAWYLALSDYVGHTVAPSYADDVVIWREKPTDVKLKQWQLEYDQGYHGDTITQEIREKVAMRVNRLHKQQYRDHLRLMMDVATALLKDGKEIVQPIALKYLADGINQGMLAYNVRTDEAPRRVGRFKSKQKAPTQRALAAPKEQAVTAEFRVLEQDAEITT